MRRTARLGAAIGTGGARVAGTIASSAARRDREAAAEALLRRHLETAERMVDVLGTMKGAAMKAGQLFSFIEPEFVPDQFRPLYQQALARLRDSAPPVDYETVRPVLEREWEAAVETVCADFETVPRAAASIGQVHRATLHDGRVVAVKVQYPGVAEAVRADLQNVGLLMQLARLIAPGIDARAVAREIRERIADELDYELEAANQRLFARMHRGHPLVHVPDVVGPLSRRRVLVQEWVDGARFDDWLDLPERERDRLGEIVDRFAFGAMHRIHVFNSDPHPGNWLRMADGRVACLDFGAVVRVDPQRLRLDVEVITAILARDRERVRDLLVRLGWLRRPDRVALDRLFDQIDVALGWILEDRPIRVDAHLVRTVIAAANDPRSGFLDVMRAGALPPEAVMFRRLEAGVLALLGRLRACANWYRIARELWYGDPPSTDLGAAEQEFWARRLPGGHA